MILRKIKLLAPLSVICTGMLNTACTRDQVMRMTYETLRQEDCHRNDFRTDYCDRSYAFEYAEYKLLRNSYLKQTANDELAMTDNSLFIIER
ncbi:MAG: hypothetical protein KDJ38_13935 [Gammaproteobacteria bacterium]|nr:hypothetical protein [Gammaproteobacteria bacterium]